MGMEPVILEIPDEVAAAAKIPRAQLREELLRRLAAALYSDGVIGGAAACRLAGLGKAEFQHWLGEHRITQPLEESDFREESEQLKQWLDRD